MDPSASVKVTMLSVITSLLLALVNVKAAAAIDFSQTCTSGFLSPASFNGTTSTQQVVPLLGLFGNTFSSEQWIFPDLRFNCHGTVDRWIFNGQGSTGSSCTAWLTTWRLDSRFSSGSVEVYDRVSAADTRRARIIRQNGGISTYELVTQGIRVQPGDIFGIEIDCFSAGFGNVVNKLNVLGIRDTGRSVTSRSYRRSSSGSTIHISPTRSFERNYFPLVEAAMAAEINDVTTDSMNMPFTTSDAEENIVEITTDRITLIPFTISEAEEEDIIEGSRSTTVIERTTTTDQAQKNTRHVYILAAIIVSGCVSLAVLTTIVACTCILLGRRKTKAHTYADKHDTKNRSSAASEFESMNSSSTVSVSMERNFAYSSSNSQTAAEADCIRCSNGTVMDENVLYNALLEEGFTNRSGNNISMEANSAYRHASGSPEMSTGYEYCWQNGISGTQTETEDHYDTIDSVAYFQGSVAYEEAPCENDVTTENGGRDQNNIRQDTAFDGRESKESMVDCDAYKLYPLAESKSNSYDSIDKIQTDAYETVDSNDSHDVTVSDVNTRMVKNIAYRHGDVVKSEAKSTNQIQQPGYNKLYHVL